jgi:uncharacterized protein YfaP (DUF2135 family)
MVLWFLVPPYLFLLNYFCGREKICNQFELGMLDAKIFPARIKILNAENSVTEIWNKKYAC